MGVFRGCTVVAAAGVVVVAVAVLLVTTLPTGAHAGFLDTLGSLVDRLAPQKEVDILGHTCVMNRRPYIKRLELHYRASFDCIGWTSIRGKAEGYVNPNTAEHNAIKDFMTKVVAAGLITKEDAKPWLGFK